MISANFHFGNDNSITGTAVHACNLMLIVSLKCYNLKPPTPYIRYLHLRLWLEHPWPGEVRTQHSILISTRGKLSAKLHLKLGWTGRKVHVQTRQS